MNLLERLNSKMAEIKAEQQKKKLQSKIQKTMALQKSLKNPIKGKGSQILERLGESFKQSGNIYKECVTPADASSQLLGQLDRFLQNGAYTGENITVFNTNRLLLSIDGTFYEITSQDLKSSVLKFAKNAGVPFNLIGQQLERLLIEGIVNLWKKHDKSYKDTNRLVS